MDEDEDKIRGGGGEGSKKKRERRRGRSDGREEGDEGTKQQKHTMGKTVMRREAGGDEAIDRDREIN